MSHKQRCVMFCNEYLSQLSLQNIFSKTDFESYYKKHKGANANAYTFGMETADFIIKNAKPVIQ